MLLDWLCSWPVQAIKASDNWGPDKWRSTAELVILEFWVLYCYSLQWYMLLNKGFLWASCCLCHVGDKHAQGGKTFQKLSVHSSSGKDVEHEETSLPAIFPTFLVFSWRGMRMELKCMENMHSVLLGWIAVDPVFPRWWFCCNRVCALVLTRFALKCLCKKRLKLKHHESSAVHERNILAKVSQ